MPQITLYLDDATERLMRERAQAAGMPYSRWVAKLIQESHAESWPADLVSSFGAYPDIPLAEPLREADKPDLPRAPW